MRTRRLTKDFVLLVISIAVAIYIVRSGVTDKFISSLNDLSWLGVVIAGLFFTSIFTTIPAIAVLGELAVVVPLPVLVIFGAIGAVIGDYIIFYIVKERVAKDIKYLLSFAEGYRFSRIFHTRLFRSVTPFLGALVIASPLPDELGITMLGLSGVRSTTFVWISFIFNGIGILIIGLIAKAVAGI